MLKKVVLEDRPRRQLPETVMIRVGTLFATNLLNFANRSRGCAITPIATVVSPVV